MPSKRLNDLRGVPLVSYVIADVLRVRKRIMDELAWQEAVEQVLDEDKFEKLVVAAARHLVNVEPSLVGESLAHLYEQILTQEELLEEAWRLAGNLPRMRNGYAVAPWTRQVTQEWVPLLITEQVPYRNRRHEDGAIVTFKILAGSPCGWTMERFWSTRFGHVVARDIGFTNSRGKHPMHSINELVGLRLSGLIEVEKSVGKPFFDVINIPSSMLNYNRRLIKARDRIQFVCPKKYEHACRLCPIGYDQCPVAVHPRTYTKIICQSCQKKSWADPKHVELGLCYMCFTQKQLTRKD
jgi:hypothetical protein